MRTSSIRPEKGTLLLPPPVRRSPITNPLVVMLGGAGAAALFFRIPLRYILLFVPS